MNTVFFDKASDLSKDFSWKDIFSDTFKPHTKEQRAKLLVKGIGNNVPLPGQMLKQWQKPWLFFWVGIVGIVLSILTLASWNIFSGSGMGVMLFILPSFVMPLTALIFFWEMEIPGKISILETLLMMLIGGILSLTVTGILRNLITLPDADYILGPLPEEIAKFAAVWLLLNRKKYNCGLQGILIGGAVGVGFSAIESAGYAFSAYESSMEAAKELIAAGIQADYHSLITDQVVQSLVGRGILSFGGHVVWAALYGGALGLAKSQGKLQAKHLADPLVIMTWTGAVLLHTLWNLSSLDLAGIWPDKIVLFLYKLDKMYIKYIALIILGWLLLLFIMRKCIRQAIAVAGRYSASGAAASPAGGYSAASPARSYSSAAAGSASSARAAAGQAILTVTATGRLNAGKSYQLMPGGSIIFGRDGTKANARVPADTKGVSSVHCEIKVKEGVPVLIDRNSTYGTFFSGGRKLEPNVPYKIKGTVKFYLAAEENSFTIHINS